MANDKFSSELLLINIEVSSGTKSNKLEWLLLLPQLDRKAINEKMNMKLVIESSLVKTSLFSNKDKKL
jgi:hypothetical protein